jgi:hypothetical protein
MVDDSFKKWPLYQLSNKLSAMNKPNVFIKGEKKDAKRKKKLDKHAAKKKRISYKRGSSIRRQAPKAEETTDKQVPDLRAEERKVISSEKKSTFWQRNKKLILKSLVLPICLAVVGTALTATGVFAPLGVGLLAYSVFAISPLALGVAGATAAVVLNECNRPREEKEKRPKYDSKSDRQISAGNNEKPNTGKQRSDRVLRVTQGLDEAIKNVDNTYVVANEKVKKSSTRYKVGAKRRPNLHSVKSTIKNTP